MQQALRVSFRAPEREVGRSMEDIRAVAPAARREVRGGANGAVEVALELPVGTALLERVPPIIFRAQGGMDRL